MRISVQRSRYCGTGILIPVFLASTLLSTYGFDIRWYSLKEDVTGPQNLVLTYSHPTGPLSLPVGAGEGNVLREHPSLIGHGAKTAKRLALKHGALKRKLAAAASPYQGPALPRLPLRRAQLRVKPLEVTPKPVPVVSPVNSPRSPPPPDALVPSPPTSIPTPPPQADCKCKDGYTSTPTGSPCGCVIPIQVGLELSVDLEVFFPLVLELSKELAEGSFLPQSQVRITGANAVSNNQERTDVHADLVPLGVAFDNTTAQLIAQRFWGRQVEINETLFGNYTILYVNYPGLSSPPAQASGPDSEGSAGGGSPSGTVPSGKAETGAGTENRFSRGIIVIISLTSAAGTAVLLGGIWLVAVKCCRSETSAVGEDSFLPGAKKSAGSTLVSTMDSFTTLSYSSNFATYIASARNFTASEIQRATDNLKEENVVGEGGFGRVYQGRLDDGLKVAVKVLTRDDDSELLAEAELLSRLHHRNLVKLLGICIEGGVRALVYELISNGSVESHLHGPDGMIAPLNWDARIKIALGAARGLAYLHEDSNPRVIHRDFKASNILLEEDFTPKISDFGLAKVASEGGGGEHISTRVMGTFGYVAPEYAMTGHLLVKSDVYSYGVVLLELLSGRKPVDMSQPPGEENLVRWARPLLTSREGLQLLLDPVLGETVPFENVQKVAAIASMCVQPEVSHRPFMGEVVQALKLVYNDSDASDGRISFNGSHTGDGQSCGHGTGEPLGPQSSYRPSSMPAAPFSSGPTLSSESEPPQRPISASAVLSNSSRFIRQLSGSFRRYGSSGPLRTTRSRPAWYKVRYPRGGTMSDHHNSKFEIELERDYFELWP
ncbi:protein MpRLK-Pelle_Extensin1 [Marchantia polymorpha subsp. ruderalis]|nr:hypothetical protein MARPO_0055s0121 [Marchantia polymorpha]BAF79950.1 receptor-like kinase [Marchantia polymorpha]BBN02919.1 hypothetical protein Mp_2g19310 [Marchantia polymorpha subsp. ruderalis]|eukprot:PTQ37873.1 hypothetical protein MARPO_0055s0121 [Marchantia polymorpha]